MTGYNKVFLDTTPLIYFLLTNDKQLRQFKGIKYITVEEWK